MQAGKLTFTKGFLDIFPDTPSKINGYWYTHSDNYGRYFIFHEYEKAIREMQKIQNTAGISSTRGMYADTIN